jgi:hypothetical protein
MRAITITGVTLQFDADLSTSGSDLEQAREAIRLINLTLQREPYSLAAQVMGSPVQESQVTSQEVDEDEDEWFESEVDE